jgi:hypothetical protein
MASLSVSTSWFSVTLRPSGTEMERSNVEPTLGGLDLNDKAAHLAGQAFGLM